MTFVAFFGEQNFVPYMNFNFKDHLETELEMGDFTNKSAGLVPVFTQIAVLIEYNST